MSGRTRIVAFSAFAVIISVIAILIARREGIRESNITGVVLRWDPDPRNEVPIAGARITAWKGTSTESVISGATGLFSVHFGQTLHPSEPVKLRFVRQGYLPLETQLDESNRIEVIHLTPERSQPSGATQVSKISNVSVRYASKSTTTANVGSVVKTFQVVNVANVPCTRPSPCSPDGKWKATVSGVSLDAGEGNEFGNARVSCIAGPCPFTRIDTDNFSAGGRRITVSVRNWSDTATFLVEAEVFRTMASDAIRRFYPIIFGDAMNFTLPPDAEGPSIEADLNGMDIVFPLGPELNLSWGTCTLVIGNDHAKQYRCELKPGYRFS
jgi:hypothetical protein